MDFIGIRTQLLTHHPPEEYHRCTRIGTTLVCRRCLALYPATLAVMLVQFSPWALGPELRPALFGMALPATLDFVLERLGRLRYHPSRVMVTSWALAFPLGVGLHAMLRDRWDPWFWGLVGFYGVPSGLAALWRGWRELQPPRIDPPTPDPRQSGARGPD